MDNQDKNLKFMCLGGCCAGIWILGDKRIPGPIDNMVSNLGLDNIYNVFNHKLEDIFFKGTYTRVPQKKLANNDPELEFGTHYCQIKTEFHEFTMTHNDFEEEKVKIALKERIQRLYQFIDDLENNKNHYLVYSLCKADFDKNGFNKQKFDKAVQFFKDKGILSKVIFIGQTSPSNPNSIYKNHSDYAQKVIGKNYFLVKDLNVRFNNETLQEAAKRSQDAFDLYIGGNF